MSNNQIAATIAALATSINWERKGLNVQEVIQAANQGKLGKPLTDWLAARSWTSEKAKEKVLEFVCNSIVPAQPRFTVADKFTKDNTEVKFHEFGLFFSSWFLSMTEEEVEETQAVVSRLLTLATFASMTPELGENRVFMCSQLYWMLSQQPEGENPNGKNRLLLVNGSTNFLRVLDKEGDERAVNVRWVGRGWLVDADGLGYVYPWCADNQALSRK